MIPRIIHQTWKSRGDLPTRFAHWRNSFIELNPGFEAPIHDDADNRALLARTFPQLLPVYDGFQREIFRVDFIRPVYMFTTGGTYADLDYQCLRPLSLLDQDGRAIILGRMGTDDHNVHSIPNAFMASAANQGFWLGFLAKMLAAHHATRHVKGIEERPEYVTGPVVLRRAVHGYLREPDAFREQLLEFVRAHGLDIVPGAIAFGKLAVLPSHWLYPISWRDRIHTEFLGQMNREDRLLSVAEARRYFPNSIAVTYWTYSWRMAPAS